MGEVWRCVNRVSAQVRSESEHATARPRGLGAALLQSVRMRRYTRPRIVRRYVSGVTPERAEIRWKKISPARGHAARGLPPPPRQSSQVLGVWAWTPIGRTTV